MELFDARVLHEHSATRLQTMYTIYGLLWIVWAGVSKKKIWNRGRWWNCTFCLTLSCCRNLYSTSKSKVFTWALIKHLSYFLICSRILEKHHDQKWLPTEKLEVRMFLRRNWELRWIKDTNDLPSYMMRIGQSLQPWWWIQSWTSIDQPCWNSTYPKCHHNWSRRYNF